MTAKFRHIVAVLSFLSPSLSAQDLLNTNAETGNTSGWHTTATVDAVAAQEQSTGTVSPAEGNYFFSFAMGPSQDGMMGQRGVTGLIPGDTLELSGLVQTEGLGDVAKAFLLIYDDQDDLIAESYDAYESANATWIAFSLTVVVPEGAAYWEVDLMGELHAGSFVNVFFDDLRLESHGTSSCECVVMYSK